MEAILEWLKIDHNLGDLLLRLAFAIFCGGVIGWEREGKDKPAGLRTHMLVSLGSAGFMLAAMEITRAAGAADLEARLDPIRAVQGVVQGIGFLGAGAIIQSRGTVHGVTTAAGTWVVGAIGATCGAGLFGLALIFTVFTMIVLTVFQRMEKALFIRRDD